ncbi:iron uptake porin [Nodularia harveyana UHCC-0300]|uniref:Iron uptake porin n=1 Tax=Nodularia harveyana UHCC-0300 TaxID=2974287 RepID=A0ABU5UL93_9CYAN|nr:iron uptake porin [Nodularia harveyana]MEA5583171.1 iron uptake porin [Nodularia harveyana UHCC-0300]
MSNILWKSLVVSPAVLGATLLVSGTAIADPSTTTEVSVTEQQTATEVVQQPEIFAQVTNGTNVINEVNGYSNEGRENTTLSQVTSVSQFSDVQPTDWAFQALQSLVERYGCIAGYPDATYRGNRSLTRYEFAAGLNACLDRVNELIATATADMVSRQDLATLQRLQEEFSAELATLRGRVDSLEARTAELEANQFSTTTKLTGEAIFAVTDAFGDTAGDNNNTVFQNRVRLGLQSSFTGRDLLTTRLVSGNANTLDLGTATPFGTGAPSGEGLQTFNIDNTGGNNVEIDRLTYQAPVGPAQVYLAANGGKHSHYAAVNNPYFADGTDGGNGALTTFASESPIYRIGGGAGAAFTLPFGQGGGLFKPSSVTVGYLGSEANEATPGQGIFQGNYAALGQLNFSVSDRLALAATYVHGYHGAGSTIFDAGENNSAVVGTSIANRGGIDRANGSPNPFATNSYGVSAAFRPSNKLSVSGFVSYTDVNGFGANDASEVWSYGVGLALPDFGKRGNVLGIFGGAVPYAHGAQDGFNKVPYQVEGFYKYRVSDNVSVTPGVIWVTNPGQSSDNDDAFIGTLRTTFTF